jgi:tRNA (guanine37-N1)-methyltransferase
VRIDVITIFPGMFAPVLGESMMRRAQDKGLVEFAVHDLRDWSGNRHRKVDDRPYGGGPGMIMRAEPIVEAVRAVRKMAEPEGRLVLTSPAGRRFDQSVARELAAEKRLVIVAGHYEGVDERVRLVLGPEEVSVGDYVLTGGELPAMAIADAVVRLVPGVLGAEDGTAEESFEGGLLEFPQYTRPVDYEGHRVPAVLRGGDHAKVAAYRQRQRELRTAERRPDLMSGSAPDGAAP